MRRGTLATVGGVGLALALGVGVGYAGAPLKPERVVERTITHDVTPEACGQALSAARSDMRLASQLALNAGETASDLATNGLPAALNQDAAALGLLNQRIKDRTADAKELGDKLHASKFEEFAAQCEGTTNGGEGDES